MKRYEVLIKIASVMLLLGLFAFAMSWWKHLFPLENHNDPGSVSEYPISPLSHDVWMKDRRNRFLRFPTNSGINQFETYDLDLAAR